jgi:hypothetical protein
MGGGGKGDGEERGSRVASERREGETEEVRNGRQEAEERVKARASAGGARAAGLVRIRRCAVCCCRPSATILCLPHAASMLILPLPHGLPVDLGARLHTRIHAPSPLRSSLGCPAASRPHPLPFPFRGLLPILGVMYGWCGSRLRVIDGGAARRSLGDTQHAPHLRGWVACGVGASGPFGRARGKVEGAIRVAAAAARWWHMPISVRQSGWWPCGRRVSVGPRRMLVTARQPYAQAWVCHTASAIHAGSSWAREARLGISD